MPAVDLHRVDLAATLVYHALSFLRRGKRYGVAASIPVTHCRRGFQPLCNREGEKYVW